MNPLHCLKGHLLNLYAELPNILTGPLREKCEKIINAHTWSDKVKCVDLMTAAIRLLLPFKQKASPLLTTLMETIVRVSGIMYATKLNVVLVQSWNYTILCGYTMNSVVIFSQLPSIYEGIDFLAHSYMHDLESAGLEYEIVCSRSVNTECQEHLFAQVKRIALTC